MSELTTESLKERKKIFHNAFSTHDGKLAMALLVDDFVNRTLFHPDTHVMAQRVAEHDLVQYLREMAGGPNNE